MSILHLETGRHLYGGARQVLHLVKGLADRGVDAVLVAPEDSSVASAAQGQGIPCETVGLRGEADLIGWTRLMRRFGRRDVELVHVHSRRGADTLGGLAAALAGAPAVLTRRVDHPEPRWVTAPKYLLYRHVIAISEAVKGALMMGGVREEEIDVIPSAVDVGDWSSARSREALNREFELEEGDFAVAMVAQFIPRKGHALLLRALARLGAEGPAPCAVLFGRGPLEAETRDLAGSLGLEDRVRFAGFHDDLGEWLGAFDCLAHPASREGLGVAVLEAGAAAVPVVAARVGGIPEIVLDGETGVLFPAGDDAALAAALHGLMESPQKRAALGSRARARVEARFSVDAMVEGNLRVYAKLLGASAFL